MTRSLLRIIDANFNRSKEGLRVCEDIARFIWDDAALATGFKHARHQLTGALLAIGFKKALLSRDIGGDVGRGTIKSESKRQSINDVFFANSQRVKESLRVLEELAKLIDPTISQTVKKIRYSIYALETQAIRRR